MYIYTMSNKICLLSNFSQIWWNSFRGYYPTLDQVLHQYPPAATVVQEIKNLPDGYENICDSMMSHTNYFLTLCSWSILYLDPDKKFTKNEVNFSHNIPVTKIQKDLIKGGTINILSWTLDFHKKYEVQTCNMDF